MSSPVNNAKKSPAALTNKFSSKHVTIRMYNVGFGDAFLLVFPAPDRPRKVLIDCGVHFQGKNPKAPIKEIVKQIIADVTEDSGPRIDLVIATHRHQDHVEGFDDASWKQVEVGEVWLPWTEDYTDPDANAILEAQSSKAKKLSRVLEKMVALPGRFGLSAARVAALEALKAFSANSLSNAEAMATLHEGFKGGKTIPRQYLPFKERNRNSFEPGVLPGVNVHILGPSRDPEVIRDMDPSGNEEWLRLMEMMASADYEPHQPFHEGWSEASEKFDPDHRLLKLSELKMIEKIGEGTELNVAVQLEKAVNGTSLMIIFQMGRAWLLFPGDAQNGTWKTALADTEWRELMGRTNFYKIGHHGSHNATPKEFVFDVLRKNFKAMTPVRPIKTFKFIPKTELMAALKAKPGKIARADKPAEDPKGFSRDPKDFIVETKVLI
jgi:beta-lactamase superfamily II metal-dependent hydrolase